MKSPICRLCNKDFGSKYFHTCAGGALLQFSDYVPLPQGAAGHPRGLEWFCDEHLPAASALAAHTTEETLFKLTERYGAFPPYQAKPVSDPELWVSDSGPNTARIFSILRQATGLSPSEAQKRIKLGIFKVAEGWPLDFHCWQVALEDAGATVEIRFP